MYFSYVKFKAKHPIDQLLHNTYFFSEYSIHPVDNAGEKKLFVVVTF